MHTRTGGPITALALMGLVLALALPTPAFAAPPVVKTVPWVATNPLIPHDTWSGKSVHLKGTSDVQGATIQWTWDFGDGTPVATGTVTNMYDVEAVHAYAGSVGTVFTARLTVLNTLTGETGNQAYYVAIRDKSLEVEANVAIDEGLWYLHTTQTRSTSGGQPIGYWNSGNAGSSWIAVSAANVNAFLVNGHLATGNPSNPYTETATRGVNYVLTTLATTAIPASQTNPVGTFSPDGNGNGYAAYVAQGYPIYQGGPVIDALVATGTPNAVAALGAAPSGANPGIQGRTYKAIVQDMVDYFAYCQYDSGAGAGGWRYNCQDFPDNSAAQWAAIGIIAAVRQFGVDVSPPVLACNRDYWLTYSQWTSSNVGAFGYTGQDSAWGLQATTPSGMVQLAMDGVGRSNPKWDKAETYMRNNFCNTGGAYYAVRDYYYGMFAFVKAMLLHVSSVSLLPEPLDELAIQPAGTNPINWYHAEAAKGAQCDGVARTLLDDQNPAGYWYGHNYSGDQYPFETAWAIMMLGRTLFESGAPVAVAKATPNPAVAGQIVNLSGADSFHQDAGKLIDSWAWDLDNDGVCDDASGPFATISFPAVGNYPVKLCVTDNGVPEKSASTIVTIVVSTPPVAPTANAGGPYSFCPGRTWFLDGTGSTNPDNGQSEPGKPGDFIKEFAWDLDGDGQFDDAFGAQPNVTAFFTGKGVGSYLVQLKVTDNTAASFPSSGMPDLSDTDSAVVTVHAATDPACFCISNLTARAKPTKADLVWTPTGAHHYNIYRSTISGGPYLKIAATTSTYSTYADFGLFNGTTYYWVVRPATQVDFEVCQSNQASAKPIAR